MNRYSLYSVYSLMFVLVGSSMQASQLQLLSAPEAELSSLAEPSRYIADPSQISRPCSPSRSMASQVMASFQIAQEEEKASSSMPLVQPVAVGQKAIKYPLSNEIKLKAKDVTSQNEIKQKAKDAISQEEIFRAATLKKIEDECLLANFYFSQNKSLMNARLRKYAPQLDKRFVEEMEAVEQEAALKEIAEYSLRHYDPNNFLGKTENEKFRFLYCAVYGSASLLETIIRFERSEWRNEWPRPSFNFVRIVKENSMLDSHTKFQAQFIERAQDAYIDIRDQLSLLVVDQPEKLKELIREEYLRQAYAIHEELKLRYTDLSSPVNIARTLLSRMVANEAHEREKQEDKARKLIAEKQQREKELAKQNAQEAKKQAKKDKKCVIQ